jgi:hypothetical protein
MIGITASAFEKLSGLGKGTLHLMKNRRVPNFAQKNITKFNTQKFETSSALEKVIKTSQNPVPALKAISKNPETAYSGGSTAANIRKALQAQEKPYRNQLKRQPSFKNIDMRKSY